MSELKPCPFCGGKAEVAYAINDYNRWGSMCTCCSASVEVGYEQFEDTPEAAAAAWSTRTDPEKDRLQRENYQLRDLVRLAVEDMKHCVVDTGCEVCLGGECEGFDDCDNNFVWHHADKLKELGVEV